MLLFHALSRSDDLKGDKVRFFGEPAYRKDPSVPSQRPPRKYVSYAAAESRSESYEGVFAEGNFRVLQTLVHHKSRQAKCAKPT